MTTVRHVDAAAAACWRSPLYGVFAVDDPSANASAVDVLTRHNAALDGGPSGWFSNAFSEMQNEFVAHSAVWVGTVPADRKDWIDFVQRIPHATTNVTPVSVRVPYLATLTDQRGQVRVPITGYFARPGYWDPVFTPSGSILRMNGKLAFAWVGAPGTTDAVLRTVKAWFVHRFVPYALVPDEITPAPASQGVRYGLVPIPAVDAPRAQMESTVIGHWDYAIRSGVNTAVVTWQGRMPCDLEYCSFLLNAQGTSFALCKTTQRAPATVFVHADRDRLPRTKPRACWCRPRGSS